MRIDEARELSDAEVAAIDRLVPQLSPGAPPPGRERLDELVRSEACTLLLARDEKGAVVGTLTLVAYPIPTGVRVWIEDVVVDEAARGRGVGEALVRAAVQRAAALGATAVNLTSNPRREAANRLYRRMGFELRDTNSYRMHLRRDDGASTTGPPGSA